MRLELEHFRLQTWGKNAGIASGSLPPSLLEIHPLICERLNRIEWLLTATDELKRSYGLTVADATALRFD